MNVKRVYPFLRALTRLLLGTWFLFGLARPAGAQSGTEFVEVGVDYDLGVRIEFSVRIVSSVPIQSASVTFREPQGIAQTHPLEIRPDGLAGYHYDASGKTLTPFSPILFWFSATLTDGNVMESGTYNFIYSDNRFAWKSIEEGMLRVHWYTGDEAFAQAVLDAGKRGLQSVYNIIPLDVTTPIDIWVYPNTDDLKSALVLGGMPWVAGHAGPEWGVALISVEPGPEQSIELERQTPHELAHVMLYRRVGPNYVRLPKWLTEGMASMAELYPNPDFITVLGVAARENSLLPLTDLCDTFPSDNANAFLAYAEAESFVRYIVDNHGTTGLSALAFAYADGLDCEQGARQALNQTLSQMEVSWRENKLGENRSGVIAYNLFPYMVLLGLVLIVPVWGAIGRIVDRRKRARSAR